MIEDGMQNIPIVVFGLEDECKKFHSRNKRARSITSVPCNTVTNSADYDIALMVIPFYKYNLETP